MAAWQRGSVAAWQRGSVAAWQRGSVAAWQRGGVAGWHRGTAAPWHRGTVAAWNAAPQHLGALAHCNVRIFECRCADLDLTSCRYLLLNRSYVLQVDIARNWWIFGPGRRVAGAATHPIVTVPALGVFHVKRRESLSLPPRASTSCCIWPVVLRGQV